MVKLEDLHPIGIGTWTISKDNYEKDIKVLCKCTDICHIDENLQSLNFEMEAEDYVKLDKFRQPFFDNLKVKYRENEDGILIHQVPNQDPLGKEKYIATYGTDKERMRIK